VIRFQKSASNTIVVTLTENSTVSNPIYLWLFTNQQTNVAYYFIGTDISQYKERYNKFIITDQANPNTLNGQTQLGNEGFYDYEIYQTSLSSTSGLTTAEDAVQYITKVVEVGLVWVILETTSNTAYDPQTNTTIVYQPD